MSEEEYPASWDDVPEREALPPPGRGPGIKHEGDLVKMKGADLIDRNFAVLGFTVLPSGYAPDGNESTESDAGEKGKGEYAVVHIMLENGKQYRWNTSSKAVMRQLVERWETDTIPFRTTLENVQSKQSRYSYYRLNT